MRTKYGIGQAVKTLQPPLGETDIARCIIDSIHRPYYYKAPWDKAPAIRQYYAIHDVVSGTKFMLEESELAPDPTQAQDLRPVLVARRCVRMHELLGHEKFFEHESLSGMARNLFDRREDRDLFVATFKQHAKVPASVVWDD